MAYKDEYEVARLALDVFGLQRMRRIERELVDEYRESIKASLVLLNEENLAEVRRLAELPDAVRGYEGVKLAAIERYRAEQARILGELAWDAGCWGRSLHRTPAMVPLTALGLGRVRRVRAARVVGRPG
ncbi:DUF6537 domain-containing protein [Streptomyces sp. NPDC006132]|uniref:DUF6537 domain-containing protein n=1 Tax=Streptomyces sp. NPDC006132 TaxID=3156732 RepID=UPI00340F04CA